MYHVILCETLEYYNTGKNKTKNNRRIVVNRCHLRWERWLGLTPENRQVELLNMSDARSASNENFQS